jgi:hypothetical protein
MVLGGRIWCLALGWRLMEEGKVQKAVKEGYEI